MTTTRRDFLKAAGATIGTAQLGPGAVGLAQASSSDLARDQRRKVIFDQDTEEVMGSNETPLLMLLQSDNVDVLGVTVVTGNGWVKQETADVLKMLELVGRADVPVYMGAEFPLVDTREEMQLRWRLYGGNRLDAFLGAYSVNHSGPDEVLPPLGSFAKTKPQPGHAAEFIVNTVRKYPHQVTLFCGGALTNVALAIRIAPDIVPLTKEVIFMGTGVHIYTKTANVLYDPEAAKIVLRAPWPKLSLVTVDVAEQAHMNERIVRAVTDAQNGPVSELFSRFNRVTVKKDGTATGFRMPDEMEAAAIIDPTLFSGTRRMYVDIDTSDGPSRGCSLFWDEQPLGYGGTPWVDHPGGAQEALPPPGTRVAEVLWTVDVPRFEQLFIRLMTKPLKTDARTSQKL